MSGVVDVAFRVLAILLWAALIVATVRLTSLRTLGWIGALALAVTLRIRPIGASVDILTGRLALSVLASDLLLIAAVTLLTCTHLRQRCRPRLLAVATVAGVVVCAGWGVGIAPGPASVAPDGVLPLLGRPGVLVGLLAFCVFVVLAAALFVQTTARALLDLAPGALRRDLTAAAALAGAVLAWALTATVFTVRALAVGGLSAGVYQLLDAALAVLVGLGIAAGARPLLRGRGVAPDVQHEQVLQLHRWLTDRTRRATTSPAAVADLFVAVVEIRDRIWAVQRWVHPDEVTQAVAIGRRLGLSGPDARAFAVGVCLEIGIAGVEADDPQEPRGADLSALGGSSVQAQEIAWLAQVQRVRTEHYAAAAAAEILHGTTARHAGAM
ncbi:hypothetical protein Psed_6757 (plasmid) [Pseudonocardia dioxanivorans CB1190]|uniref:DUF6545 domain-containing protein n=1 Tax=Pseudonocardia dioxanivorans (strain ATCC 55486 / DSM 44775 / JCM 13855 / CB1190) TaxID=675635 RepID=F2L6W6_PSEUX|nr:DUF6545 domain-containing protein [Pseudonocardia dioxanivorans]AEA28838.1 hypothetical protein Psed_6757 [Pseudonocardia dioxanivorans CB1190]